VRKLTTIAILLAITAAAAIVWIYRPFEDRRAIILIVADSLRPDRLSCYGYEGHHTPNIDRLANIGMLYTDAQAAGSWALPSVGAILTAQFPPQLGLVETPADPDLEWHEHRPQLSLAIPARTPTLPQLLAEAGFHTAAFVNQPVLTRDEGFMSGFDEWYFPLGNRRIRRYEARAVHSVLPKGPTHQDQTGMDRMMSDEFAAWITNNKTSPGGRRSIAIGAL
jgi:arylsulfatase A-like enzyme